MRQRILSNVGTVSTAPDIERFKQMAEYIKADLEKEQKSFLFSSEILANMVIESRNLSVDDTIPIPVNLKSLREEHCIVGGIHEIYGSLYDSIGFGTLMKGCPASSGIMKDIVIRKTVAALQQISYSWVT